MFNKFLQTARDIRQTGETIRVIQMSSKSIGEIKQLSKQSDHRDNAISGTDQQGSSHRSMSKH